MAARKPEGSAKPGLSDDPGITLFEGQRHRLQRAAQAVGLAGTEELATARVELLRDAFELRPLPAVSGTRGVPGLAPSFESFEALPNRLLQIGVSP